MAKYNKAVRDWGAVTTNTNSFPKIFSLIWQFCWIVFGGLNAIQENTDLGTFIGILTVLQKFGEECTAETPFGTGFVGKGVAFCLVLPTRGLYNSHPHSTNGKAMNPRLTGVSLGVEAQHQRRVVIERSRRSK